MTGETEQDLEELGFEEQGLETSAPSEPPLQQPEPAEPPAAPVALHLEKWDLEEAAPALPGPDAVRSPEAETEAQLNALIAGCRRMIEQVAMPSMCQMARASDRVNFMDAAVRIVEAGAAAGRTVAKLRRGAVAVAARERLVLERVAQKRAES